MCHASRAHRHDEKEPTPVAFARDHRETFEGFDLLATGTTGKHLRESTGLEVE